MLKPEFSRSYFLLFGLLFHQIGNTQIYANRQWVQQSPVTGSGIYHTSTIVVSGKLYVTVNVVNGNGDTDIYTMKLDSNGDTLWTASYGGSMGGDDYGIELKASTDGYIYVIGAAENTSTGYDYCLLKYNATTGSQAWVRNWNGAGNGTDIPSALYIDGSFVFITGGSEASNGFSDYATLKISNTNSLAWAKYYDYNDLHDGATTITKSQNKIVVSGGSAAAVGDWDIATVPYDIMSGSQGTANRSNITGATMAEANAMTTDSLNNLYITGYAEVGGDRQIQTIRLDSALSLVWLVNHNTGTGLDEGNDIAVDNNGSVYVTGYSEPFSGKFKAITIKYDAADADTLWVKTYGNTTTENGVKARKMNVQPDGDVYITGTSYNGALNSFSFARYDTDGRLELVREYQADTLDDDAFRIEVDGNDVYITGFTETISGTRMTSIKYSLQEKDTAILYNAGDPVYKNRDLIIRVDPSVINTGQIDQLQTEFWEPEAIFDSVFVADLYRKVQGPCSSAECDINIYRIFSRLKTTDTVTTSRLGKQIPIPDFWSVFVFEFPSGVDIEEIADSIYTLFPQIKYTDYNYITGPCSVPNDPEYYMQVSLHTVSNPSFDSAHVNVEPAWDHTVGEPFVRVGIMDDGIYQNHSDFEDLLSTGCKVVDGWDYSVGGSGINVYTTGSPGGFHGTGSGGIIGANRNDNNGVAGIAGGDYAAGNPGVSLYDLRIMQNNEIFNSDITFAANAIIEASIESTDDLGYGLHVLNNSWRIGVGTGAPASQANINVLREAIHFANRAQVTFVAARGNEGDSLPIYPAVMEEDWVINVGGTGADGNYYDGFAPDDGYNETSSFGMELDIAAPASHYVSWVPEIPNSWWYFGGTSGATPHVSGAATLLMSYHNDTVSNPDNLAPEDVENLIQLSATDVDAGGYDNYTGYGRLNVGNAVNMLAEDNCYIIHYGISDLTSYTVSFSQIITNDTIKFNEFYSNADSVDFHPYYVNTKYRADVYEVTFNFTFPYAISTDTLRAAWARHSSSSLFGLRGADSIVYPREHMEISNITENSATLKGYTYKVYQSGAFKGWAPYNPTASGFHEASFTVFRCDTNLITAEIKESAVTQEVRIYPNPTTGEQLLLIEGESGIELQVTLYDLTGNKVMDIFNGSTSGEQTLIPVSLESLPKGLYIYEIAMDNKILRIKGLKQ